MSAGPEGRSTRAGELLSVAVLALSYGLVNFDIFSVGFLMPFIARDLSLNNTQVGLLLSAFWLAFAVSCALGGAVIDAMGRRRELLTGMLLVFSFASTLPALAHSFRELLLARIALGCIEGPMLPAVQSIVSADLPRIHRGMYMGMVQTVGGSVLGIIVAPIVLLPLANHLGWHWGFSLVILPGLISAILVKRIVPGGQVERQERHAGVSRRAHSYVRGFWGILVTRNLCLCAIAAAFVVAFINITLGFLPLFLMRIRGLEPDRTSLLVSVLGISSALMGVVIPSVSDRVGRKPAVICSSVLAVLSAMTVARCVMPTGLLSTALFVGWTLAGSSPLLLATIPAESAAERLTATAIGAISGIGTLTGGVLGPLLAGLTADRWGLSTVLVLSAGCALAVGVVAIGLRETAPLMRSRI